MNQVGFIKYLLDWDQMTTSSRRLTHYLGVSCAVNIVPPVGQGGIVCSWGVGDETQKTGGSLMSTTQRLTSRNGERSVHER